MHTWAALLLAATALITGGALPLDKPRERGFYFEENLPSSSLNGSQVPSTELTSHNTTTGGVEKDNASQTSIKTSDVPPLHTLPSNISVLISSGSKNVSGIDLSTNTTNKTEKIVRSRPIPIQKPLVNTTPQSNSADTVKTSKKLENNSRTETVEPETFPTKLPSGAAFSGRSSLNLTKISKIFKLPKSNFTTDPDQSISHPESQQNSSITTSRKTEPLKSSVKATPSTFKSNRTNTSKSSVSSHESHTANEKNITRKQESPIKLNFSDVNSNIDVHPCHTAQASSIVASPHVVNDKVNVDDGNDDLKSNDRENVTSVSPKHTQFDRSTDDHVPHNETMI